jgi:hypothetical protein
MTQTALVVVHPKSAVKGPAQKIDAQWQMIDAWKGPIFILDDDREIYTYSTPANMLFEMIDVAIDERESVGIKTRLDADDEEGLLDIAVDELLTLHPEGDFLLTGAWAEGCVAFTAELIRGAGRDVTIDETAIAEDDTDD